MKNGSEHAVSVRLDQAAYREACGLADRAYAMFRDKRGYYRNTPNSHLRGKVGEIACEQWLVGQGVECHAAFKNADETGDADIVIGGESGLRVEVKTWNQRYWLEMGRCIAVGQLELLERKADVVMWCSTPNDLEAGMRVDIAGWSSMEDIRNAPQRMTGPPGKLVHNYQIAPEEIRSPAGLLPHVKNQT